MADEKAASAKKDDEKKEDLPADLEELHDALKLRLGKRYSFVAANSARSIVGRLQHTHQLGAVVMQDGQTKASFLPWHNVFAVEPLE